MAMTLQICLAEMDDLPEIVALQSRSLRELSKGTYSEQQIEALVTSQERARTHSFTTNDEVIYIACLPSPPSAIESEPAGKQIVAIAALIHGRSQIGGLYVHPDYARRGIASQLLSQLELTAITQQRRVLRVMSSRVAVPFYEAMGYRRLFSRMVTFDGQRVGCMEMAKALNNKDLSTELTRQAAWTIAPIGLSMAAAWLFFILI